MGKQIIKNFDEWIFEAAAPGPKKTAAPTKQETIPAGYVKSNLDSQKNVQQNTKDQTTGVKGWKALKNTDTLQTSGLGSTTTGLASDKVEDFDKAAKDRQGTLVMSPTIWGDSAGSSFVVGFPFSQPSLEGEKASEIILSNKYLLFTPFEDGEPKVLAPNIAANVTTPANFRLIATDKLANIGLQSLMWCIGVNNSAKAKEEMKKMSPENVYSTIKKGLESLSQISKVANVNDSAKIINDGYNALISSEKLGTFLFTSLVSGHPKVTLADIEKTFPPKKA